MNPAQAIAAALAKKGYLTKRSQARLLNVGETEWGRLTNGKQDPKADSVSRWLKAAYDADVYVELQWSYHDILVVVVELEVDDA